MMKFFILLLISTGVFASDRNVCNGVDLNIAKSTVANLENALGPSKISKKELYLEIVKNIHAEENQNLLKFLLINEESESCSIGIEYDQYSSEDFDLFTYRHEGKSLFDRIGQIPSLKTLALRALKKMINEYNLKVFSDHAARLETTYSRITYLEGQASRRTEYLEKILKDKKFNHNEDYFRFEIEKEFRSYNSKRKSLLGAISNHLLHLQEYSLQTNTSFNYRESLKQVLETIFLHSDNKYFKSLLGESVFLKIGGKSIQDTMSIIDIMSANEVESDRKQLTSILATIDVLKLFRADLDAKSQNLNNAIAALRSYKKHVISNLEKILNKNEIIDLAFAKLLKKMSGELDRSGAPTTDPRYIEMEEMIRKYQSKLDIFNNNLELVSKWQSGFESERSKVLTLALHKFLLQSALAVNVHNFNRKDNLNDVLRASFNDYISAIEASTVCDHVKLKLTELADEISGDDAESLLAKYYKLADIAADLAKSTSLQIYAQTYFNIDAGTWAIAGLGGRLPNGCGTRKPGDCFGGKGGGGGGGDIFGRFSGLAAAVKNPLDKLKEITPSVVKDATKLARKTSIATIYEDTKNRIAKTILPEIVSLDPLHSLGRISQLNHVTFEKYSTQILKDTVTVLSRPDVFIQNAVKVGEVALSQIKAVADDSIHDTGKVLGKAAHDTGKTAGDIVKEARDAISAMQGMPVEKNLAEIRSQIRSCRENTRELNLVLADLEYLKTYVTKLQSEEPEISLEGFNEKIVSKLKSMERLKNGMSIPLSIGAYGVGYAASTVVFATTSASTAFASVSWAAYGGVYTMAAAAIVIALSSSATKEIEHETRKLKDCGSGYQAVFNEVYTSYEQYISKLEAIKTKVQEFNAASDKYIALINEYESYIFESDEAPIPDAFYISLEVFINEFEKLLSNYPDYLQPEKINKIRSRIHSMSTK